jgi:hypothetical protein
MIGSIAVPPTFIPFLTVMGRMKITCSLPKKDHDAATVIFRAGLSFLLYHSGMPFAKYFLAAVVSG